MDEENIQYEIDYLPVGNGKIGGDAIAIRFGNFADPNEQYVVVIDGGTKESGAKLVEHIKQYYNTDYVDLVVATHLHQDHTSGLTEVLENLRVGKLAIHLPWDYASDIKRMTKTESSVSRIETKLEKSINTVSNLCDLAEEKGVEIIQSFRGDVLLDKFIVLSPSEDYYKELLANFEKTPEVKPEHKILDEIDSFVKGAIEWIEEEIRVETLSDDYEDTTAENNSSIVLLFQINGKRYLFTGDAGKDALFKVIEYANENNIDLNNIDFLDVPHHGSKRNLGPSILNVLSPNKAFISCPKDGDPKKPSRKVVNALIRRNCEVYTTKGNSLGHNIAIRRNGWGPATPETFFNVVEK